jgi:hypothetical protein
MSFEQLTGAKSPAFIIPGESNKINSLWKNNPLISSFYTASRQEISD